MKIKSFECPKSIRNYKEKNTWSIRRLVDESFVPSAQRIICIVDCRFYGLPQTNRMSVKEDLGGFCAESAGCANIST